MSDYINLRDAIALCAGWSENSFERRVPTRGELIAQRTEILELAAEAILADANATHRNLIRRRERERDLANQPLTSIDDALDKLRAEIAKQRVEVASTKDKSQKTALLKKISARERVLERLKTSREAKSIGRSKDDLVNAHRNYLLTELEKAQAPAVAARDTWDRTHDQLRRAVDCDALRAYARLRLDGSSLGIIKPLAAELFPEPGDLRVDLPYGANGERFPAEVVFVRADLERVFLPIAEPTNGKPANTNRNSRRSHHPTRDRAVERMETAISEGRETLESLRGLTEQALADVCEVRSRDTARLALAQLVARQTATSSG